MLGTIVVILLVVAVAVGGFFIYKKHKETIDREAARIEQQAADAAANVKKKVTKK